MADIVVSGNSSGSVTLRAPDVSGTTILTLPTTSGTLVTTAGGSTVPFALGSAAAPSITFTGDTNTGMFSPGADTIAFTEGGVESMRIDASGNVGIGTASPNLNGNNLALTISSAQSGTTTAALDIRGFRTTDGGTSQITFYNGSNLNALIGVSRRGADNSGAFEFYTNNAGSLAERMRITSAGDVGIGTSSPTQRLDVAGDARVSNSTGNKRFYIGQATPSANDGASLEFQNSNSQFNWAIRSSFNVGGALEFCPSSVAGGVSYTTPSVVMNSNGVIALRGGNTSATGVGIAFPGTQSASSDANTLDDYEEGTWTPTVVGTSTAGTATYSVQQARYTKIGRMVYVEFYLSWGSGTGTGNLQIEGLPFTSASSSTFPSLSIGYWDSISVTSGSVPLAYVNSGFTRIVMSLFNAGGGSPTSVGYDANGAMQVAGCYSV